MSTGAIIGIVIAVIVVVAVVVVASAEMRRARLRRQFGPEYDRLVQKLGSKRKADAELAERERRVRALNIRDLSPEQQASYSGDWAAVQERFVDTPAEAVGAAHVLIGNVMRDRGYPVNDRTATLDALSVHHNRAMEGYRATMDLRTDSASTEQLREAMIHYRALFEDLTGLRETRGEPARERVAAIRDRADDRYTDDRYADDRYADDRNAAAADGTRTAETAEPVTTEPVTEARVTREPVTREPVTEDPAVEERAVARDDERAAQNASRTAYPPR